MYCIRYTPSMPLLQTGPNSLTMGESMVEVPLPAITPQDIQVPAIAKKTVCGVDTCPNWAKIPDPN